MYKRVTLKLSVFKFKQVIVEVPDEASDKDIRRAAFEMDNGNNFKERENFRPARRVEKIEDCEVSVS